MEDELTQTESYQLRLFVNGRSSLSRRARANLDKICEFDLKGDVSVETIDVLAEPDRAEQDKVLVTPTLLRISPKPERRVVGDFSNRSIVLSALGLGSQKE